MKIRKYSSSLHGSGADATGKVVLYGSFSISKHGDYVTFWHGDLKKDFKYLKKSNIKDKYFYINI